MQSLKNRKAQYYELIELRAQLEKDLLSANSKGRACISKAIPKIAERIQQSYDPQYHADSRHSLFQSLIDYGQRIKDKPNSRPLIVRTQEGHEKRYEIQKISLATLSIWNIHKFIARIFWMIYYTFSNESIDKAIITNDIQISIAEIKHFINKYTPKQQQLMKSAIKHLTSRIDQSDNKLSGLLKQSLTHLKTHLTK